jgi:hypothetical protein
VPTLLGVTVSEPLVGRLPLQAPEAVQLLAPDAFQVMVAEPLLRSKVGLLVLIVIVGGGGITVQELLF